MSIHQYEKAVNDYTGKKKIDIFQIVGNRYLNFTEEFK